MKVWLPSRTLSRFARTISMRLALFGLTTLALIAPLTSNCFGQFTASHSVSSAQDHSILVREAEPLDSVEPRQSGATPMPYSARRQTSGKTAPQATNALDVGGGFISSSRQPDRADRQDIQARSLSSNSLRNASAETQHAAVYAVAQNPTFSAPQAPTFSAPQAPTFSAPKAPVFSARQIPKPRSEENVAALPTERRVRSHQQTQANQDVIIDRSVAPASYSAPVQSFQNQSFQNQSSRPLQSLQRRQNAGQANSGNGRGNQVAQNATNRQGNRSGKKTSASAKVLISRFGFKTPQDNSENLVPLRLADVLNQGQVRANRGQLIDQYWETFGHWAQSVSVKQHRDWVNGLRVSKSTDQSTVGVAKSSTENEVTSNRIQLGKSQAKLKSLLGTQASIAPADLPTVTMVKTNFQAFKERGLIPARLEGIDQTLTDLHDLILSRADTVLLAERTAEQVKGYYQSNQATIEQLLGAGRAWQSAEADFVSSVIEYNKTYADYALALPYGQAPVEQVVAMLVVPVKVTPTPADSSAGRNFQQAQVSPTPSRPASSNRSVQQRSATRPQGGQNSRVRAASNGFGGSSVPQSRTPRPMPDFSEPSNASTAATSFAASKAPEFRPNSVASPRPDPVASRRGNPAARREARASSSSFGGGSAGPPAAPRARGNATNANSGFGGRKPSPPVTQPVSQSAGGFSASFSNPAQSQVKGPSVDPFSSRPAAIQPAAKPPVKPDTFFGGSGTSVK